MNKEAMLATADHIEKHPDKYNQADWCGTACCIAGHAVLVDSKSDVLSMNEHDIPEEAREFLGLSYTQGCTLFGAAAQYWPEPYRMEFRILFDAMQSMEAELENASEEADEENAEDLKLLEAEFDLKMQAIKRVQSYIAVRMLRAIAAGEVKLVAFDEEEDGEVERG